jgi:hypothetical protein
MDDKRLVLCLLYCSALVFSSIDVAAVVVGAQHNSRTFDLASWLFVSGSTDLVMHAVLLWLIVRLVQTESEQVMCAVVPVHCVAVLLKAAWFVVGIVLISPHPCDSVCIMGIVQLVWLGVQILGSVGAFRYYPHLLCESYDPV